MRFERHSQDFKRWQAFKGSFVHQTVGIGTKIPASKSKHQDLQNAWEAYKMAMKMMQQAKSHARGQPWMARRLPFNTYKWAYNVLRDCKCFQALEGIALNSFPERTLKWKNSAICYTCCLHCLNHIKGPWCKFVPRDLYVCVIHIQAGRQHSWFHYNQRN